MKQWGNITCFGPQKTPPTKVILELDASFHCKIKKRYNLAFSKLLIPTPISPESKEIVNDKSDNMTKEI